MPGESWARKWGPHLVGLAALVTAISTAASSCEWLKPDRVGALFDTVRKGDVAKTAEINSILTSLQVQLARLEGRLEGLESRVGGLEGRMDAVVARRPTRAAGGRSGVVLRPPGSPAATPPEPTSSALPDLVGPRPGCLEDGDCPPGHVCSNWSCIAVKTIKAKLPDSLEQAVRKE